LAYVAAAIGRRGAPRTSGPQHNEIPPQNYCWLDRFETFENSCRAVSKRDECEAQSSSSLVRRKDGKLLRAQFVSLNRTHGC
jgi:hypothetical protein